MNTLSGKVLYEAWVDSGLAPWYEPRAWVDLTDTSRALWNKLAERLTLDSWRPA